MNKIEKIDEYLKETEALETAFVYGMKHRLFEFGIKNNLSYQEICNLLKSLTDVLLFAFSEESYELHRHKMQS